MAGVSTKEIKNRIRSISRYRLCPIRATKASTASCCRAASAIRCVSFSRCSASCAQIASGPSPFPPPDWR